MIKNRNVALAYSLCKLKRGECAECSAEWFEAVNFQLDIFHALTEIIAANAAYQRDNNEILKLIQSLTSTTDSTQKAKIDKTIESCLQQSSDDRVFQAHLLKFWIQECKESPISTDICRKIA